MEILGTETIGSPRSHPEAGSCHGVVVGRQVDRLRHANLSGRDLFVVHPDDPGLAAATSSKDGLFSFDLLVRPFVGEAPAEEVTVRKGSAAGGAFAPACRRSSSRSLLVYRHRGVEGVLIVVLSGR